MSLAQLLLRRAAEILIGAITAWAPIPAGALAVLVLFVEVRGGGLLGAIGAVALGFCGFGLSLALPLLGLPECPATRGVDLRCVAGPMDLRVAVNGAGVIAGAVALGSDLWFSRRSRGARAAVR